MRGDSTDHRVACRRPARAALVVVFILTALLIGAGAGWWWSQPGPSAIRTKTRTPADPSPDGAWFEEAAKASGLAFTHRPARAIRYWFPEIMGSGVGLFDYDGDDDLDVYFVQSGDLDRSAAIGPGGQLFRNRGDGAFEDVTAAAGLGGTGYGMGCTCGDYDADSDIDLYVTNVGPNVLYRNNGDGTFADVTAEAGVGDAGWGTSCGFVDYDSDDDLDLYVVNYITWSPQHELRCSRASGEQDYCSPNNYNAPAPSVLYRNDGGRFSDVTVAAGLRKAFGNGLGLAWGDLNGDGRVDLYVANDGLPNQLWINNGDGTFFDQALLAGCAVNREGYAEAGMGVQAIDLEADGALDLFVTHLNNETNTFFSNRDGLFTDTTAALALAMPSLVYTGFGVGFADFDHDADLDLYVVNGRVTQWGPPIDANHPFAEPNQLYRNTGGHRFEEVLPRGGTAELLVDNSRGAAFGDVDNDGDVDIVVSNNGGDARLLRNTAGARGQWIMFRVLDARGRDALGSTVWIEAAGRKQRRDVQVAFSYCSSNDPRVHFGLGTANSVEKVTVRWPDGTQSTHGMLPAGRIYELREP